MFVSSVPDVADSEIVRLLAAFKDALPHEIERPPLGHSICITVVSLAASSVAEPIDTVVLGPKQPC